LVVKKKTKSQTFSAGILLHLAHNALERSAVESAESQVAVILICAAIECSLNDKVGLIFGSSDETDPKISVFLEVMQELSDDNASVKKRLRMANYILHEEKLDFGCAPFQEYAHLIHLRNALIHRHPDPLIPRGAADSYDDSRYHKTIKFFIDQSIYECHHGGAALPTIQNLAHSEAVAKWAYQTGVEVLKELDRIFAPAIPFDISVFDYITLETS
jgi:hypothetical protein